MNSIISGVEEGPIDVTLYGLEAVGKTHTACQAPGVILLDLENGAPMENVQKIPLYGKDIVFEDCMEWEEHDEELGIFTLDYGKGGDFDFLPKAKLDAKLRCSNTFDV